MSTRAAFKTVGLRLDMGGGRTWLDLPAARHGGAYSLSFADGHAETYKLNNLSAFANWPATVPANFLNVADTVSIAAADWLKLRNVASK